MKSLIILGVVVLASLAVACSGTKKAECASLRAFYGTDVAWTTAPQQADMSPAAQAANWRWRAARAAERARAASALTLTDPTLVAIRSDAAAQYASLAQAASATADGWDHGDNAALNAHAAEFDARVNARDALVTRLDAACR